MINTSLSARAFRGISYYRIFNPAKIAKLTNKTEEVSSILPPDHLKITRIAFFYTNLICPGTCLLAKRAGCDSFTWLMLPYWPVSGGIR
jgi:hypothetical protein